MSAKHTCDTYHAVVLFNTLRYAYQSLNNTYIYIYIYLSFSLVYKSGSRATENNKKQTDACRIACLCSLPGVGFYWVIHLHDLHVWHAVPHWLTRVCP